MEFREIKNIWVNTLNDILNKERSMMDFSDNRVDKEQITKEW